MVRAVLALVFLVFIGLGLSAQTSFKVLSFYRAQQDAAHISFVADAHAWFEEMSLRYNFVYDSSDHWDMLQPAVLNRYNVIIFLDARPESPEQRAAFSDYMRGGGAWMGFHFAAFALTPSQFPQDWDWYQEEFLGCGQYVSNTWAPTSAILSIEDRRHPVTRGLGKIMVSAPNEWYRWEHDLRLNPDITILASIHPRSFPLGTGPKAYEIWHSGYYPVVWSHKKYRMIYFNMGHNHMDYNRGTNLPLSHSFSSKKQNKLILQALLWLGKNE